MCTNYLIQQLTIRNAHITLQKAIYNAQKIESELFLMEEIYLTDFDMVMSNDVTTGNDPMRQQRLANLTCHKCGQKGHYRKDCPSSAGTGPVLDHTLMIPKKVCLLLWHR